MEKKVLLEAVKSSKTKTECLKKLGLRAAGGNYKTLMKYINRYNIDISHFNSDEIRKQKLSLLGKTKKIPLIDILTTGSTYNRGHLKERLFNDGIKKRKCELCGQNEMWNGKKMSLIIDHINGVWDDNRIENLRIVCPNCNATLPTHCGKNKKTEEPKIDKRTILTKNKEEFLIRSRKVERPDYNTLISEVELFGYTGTGKKYGVSDNTIRKWIKFYEKYK